MGCLYMISGSTFHANYDSSKQGADVESADDLEFVNVVKLQSELVPPSAPPTIRKPSANSDPLTVVLFPGSSADQQQSASIFRVGNVRRDSPPVPANQEPVDDIPPPEEEDENLVVTRSAGTNRYSLALTGNKEFSL
jgi:hypothetical protein